MSVETEPAPAEIATSSLPPSTTTPAAPRAPRPRRRRSLLLRTYCAVRGLTFDKEVLPNLKAEVLVGCIILIGLSAWYIERVMNERSEKAELRMRHQIGRHEKREESMMRFADGIPKNASYLRNIALQGLQISRMGATTTTPAPATNAAAGAGGVDRKQMIADRNAELQEWRKTCPHYSALCEDIIGRFSGRSGLDRFEEGSGSSDLATQRRECLRTACNQIKQCFNALNGLSLGVDEINTAIETIEESVSETTQALARWTKASRPDGKSGTSNTPGEMYVEGVRVDDVLAEIKDLTRDKLPADASVDARYAAARAVANELVLVADQLQVLALRVMHAELAELPE
jgi:hypothetical protein